MPLYEGIGSAITDKLTVVVDIGVAYTKFGFTGEYAPRCIIRSEIKCHETNTVKKLSEYKNEQDLYDMLVEFFHILYFKFALLSPKDRAVVIVESLLCPTLFRETLARVLFCHYEVSSICFLSSHLVSLSTLAIETALVIDVGYEETVVIPVCYGIPTLCAWEALPLASSAVHNYLKTVLNQVNNTGVELTESIIEDIKVRCCFVTTMERSRKFETNSNDIQAALDVEYPLEGRGNIIISGKVRETSFDLLFEEDNDYQCLSSMVLDALLKTPIDLRKLLAENIFVIGGTAMMPGFKARLKDELYEKLKANRYKDKLKIEKFKFHTAPAQDNYVAWLGGAIYGSTDFINMKCLTRDMYLKQNRVPDWPNLLDNQKTI